MTVSLVVSYIKVNVSVSKYLLTYLLTPWNRGLLEMLTSFQSVKKFLAFHETRRFITAFTNARHLSLSWASSIHFPTIHINIIFPSMSGSPKWSFPSGSPTKNLYTPLLSPIRATCSAQLILLDFIARRLLGEEHRLLRCSLCNFLHPPVTSSLLGPSILHKTLFWNTLGLRSSLVANEQEKTRKNTLQCTASTDLDGRNYWKYLRFENRCPR